MSLKVKPSYKSLISFLNNYTIVENLLREYLKKGVSFNFKNVDLLILDEINDNYSHHLTNDSSKDFLNNKIDATKENYPVFNILNFLANEHFEFIRGRNILKVHNIETFQFLYNSLDINPIYSMSIVSTIKDIPTYQERILYLKFKTDNNNIEYPKRFSFLESFSDNHFHLGGANSFAYRLHSILQNPLSLKSSKLPQDKNIKELNKRVDFRITAYATSILEKIIFSYILRNNKEHINHKEIDYTALFKKQFTLLAKGVLTKNIHTLRELEKIQGLDIEIEESREKQKYIKIVEKIKKIKNKIKKFDKSQEYNKIAILNKSIKKLEEKLESIKYIHNYDIPPLFTIRPIGKSQDISFYIKNNYYNTLIYEIVQNNIQNNIQKADKILWVLLLEILRSHPNNILKDAIYIYIVFRNILHSLIVQQQKSGGLQYFSSYSQSSIRRSKEEYEFIDSFRSILSSTYKMNIEGRINFQDTSQKYELEMIKWLNAFTLVKEEKKGTCDYEDNISFMFHFQKEEDIKSNSKKRLLIPRYHKFRNKLFTQAIAFLDFLKSSKYKNLNLNIKNKSSQEIYIMRNKKCIELKLYCNIKNNKLNETIDLLDYISGIDAASREDKVAPEVFSPIYRYIRNSLELSMVPFKYNISLYSKKSCKNKLFQFSYHVGEEFRDLTTGIRNIFEAIIFLGFRKGDRLGHALALGINPKDYIYNNKIVVTSIEEQFDNAIFSYFILDTFSKDATLKYNFYQLAMKFGSEIYRGNYSIDNYINMWLLKRNSPVSLRKFIDVYWSYSTFKKEDKKEDTRKNIFEIEGEVCAFASQNQESHIFLNNNDFNLTLNKIMHKNKLYFKMSLPDIYDVKFSSNDNICKRYEWAKKDPRAWELFLRYHFDREVKKRAFVNIDTTLSNHKEIETIQDIIMEELVSKRDIVIEVMPTSNILNSYIDSYKNHPIFRFNPVNSLDEFNNYNIRQNKLRTIINTDNPGFQATSYLNELFLMLQAGIQRGYSTADMEDYLKKIIEFGNLIYSGKASQE